MVFSSITFLTIFLPLTAILYYIPDLFTVKSVNKRTFRKYKNAVLCVVSLLFYAWGEPKNIVLMLLSIIFNFVVALHIDKCENEKHRKTLLVFSLVFNLGLLGFYKYSGFVSDNLSSGFGLTLNFSGPALPIGISFYTFQILSYVIDVYRKKVNVQRSILDFALYISMFPQLIAGPIVQYSVIDLQLSERKESFSNVAEGICLFIKGLAKKTILANSAGAIFENATAEGFAELSSHGAWTAIIFYAFQIYFDFGGYSDMAKGLGGMFGFSFPDNFRHPYTAVSVTDFWRRWHITLSSWFRDYVYIPLGGNRCSVGRNIFNLFVVWSLTGLWHGASLNFVLWGIYYFILLVLEKFIFLKYTEKLPAFIRRAVTFVFVLFGWVLFACTSVSDIVGFFGSMFGTNGLFDNSSVFMLAENSVLLIIMGVCSTELFSFNRKDDESNIRVVFRYAVSSLLFIISIVYLIGDTYNPFLYFRF